MKIPVFFVVSLLLPIFAGCVTGNQGKFIQISDGSYVYKLPNSKDNEDHCKGASNFARHIADECRYIEKKYEGQPVAGDCGVNASEDLYNDMYNLATNNDRDKRNFTKIVQLFNRIIVEKEFVHKTLDEIEDSIFKECLESMKNGTWF